MIRGKFIVLAGSTLLLAGVAVVAAISTGSDDQGSRDSGGDHGGTTLSGSNQAAVPQIDSGESPVAEVAPPKIDDPISDAEMRDLQTVAEQMGISLQAAIDRYAWNDNFSLAAAMVSESFPDSYAGAEIVNANSAWIAFRGDAPPGALETIAIFTESHPHITVDIRTNSGQ